MVGTKTKSFVNTIYFTSPVFQRDVKVVPYESDNSSHRSHAIDLSLKMDS